MKCQDLIRHMYVVSGSDPAQEKKLCRIVQNVCLTINILQESYSCSADGGLQVECVQDATRPCMDYFCRAYVASIM